MNRSLCHNSENARNRFQSGPMFTFAIAISLERHGKNISRQDFTIMARTFTIYDHGDISTASLNSSK